MWNKTLIIDIEILVNEKSMNHITHVWTDDQLTYCVSHQQLTVNTTMVFIFFNGK